MPGINTGNIVLILFATGLVLAAGFSLSIYLGRRSRGSEDWDVGGRNLPTYVIVGTQYASAIGGGVLVAHVGIGYSNGWAVLSYGLLACVGLIILSLIAKWLREQEFTTIPDILVRFYGKNKAIIVIGALMSIVMPLAATATSLVAFGKLFSMITGIKMNILIVFFALINVLFVLPAGLKTVAWSDFIFGTIMLVFSIFVTLYAVGFAGGWQAIRSVVPPTNIAFPQGMASVGWVTLGFWALALIPGTLTMQMYYQRIFAIKDARHARKSLLITAAVVITVEIFAAVLGMSIRAINPGLRPELAAGWFLTRISPWMLAGYSAFIFITLLTTTDSLLQSIVVNLKRDIWQKVIDPTMNENKGRKLNALFAFLITAIALAAAILYPQALGWLLMGYSYSAAGLLFPIFLGYLFRKTRFLSPLSSIGGMIGGIAGCILGQVLGKGIKVPYVAFGLMASLIFMLIGSLFNRPKVVPEVTKL